MIFFNLENCNLNKKYMLKNQDKHNIPGWFLSCELKTSILSF